MASNIPPHNDDAEKSVLGAALQKEEALADVMEIIKEDDFYRDQHKEIFKAMVTLNGSGIAVDTVTVTEELKKRKSLEMVGGTAYVFELPSFAPTISNAAEYAKIVSEKSMLRQLINSSTDIIDKSYSGEEKAEIVIDQAEQKIFDIAKNRQRRDYYSMRSVMESTLKRMEEFSGLNGEYTGLPTGFEKIDQMTSGLQKSDLIILAARPSVGKTAFSLNVALNAALHNDAKILFFSLEMANEMLGQRLLSIKSKVPMNKIFDGSAYNSPEEFERINDAVEALSGTNIFIDDTSGISIAEIKNKCRRLKAGPGLDLIIIDYLQLMELGEKAESRVLEVSAMTRRIKQLARDIECPVILLSQLSRDVEKRQGKSGKIPQLSDLRESGSIEQDADLVIFLSKKIIEDEEEPGIRVISIAKHRNGETGTIELAWKGEYTQFGNLDKNTVVPEKDAPF
jgi:replicative DNA helicase